MSFNFTYKSENCELCGNITDSAKNMQCGACQKVYYCSQDCKRKHWKLHKEKCKHDTKFRYELLELTALTGDA
jgi:hypothetical protein